VVAERCTAFPTAMDGEAGECRGRCLDEVGELGNDVMDLPRIVSLGNVTVDPVAVP